MGCIGQGLGLFFFFFFAVAGYGPKFLTSNEIMALSFSPLMKLAQAGLMYDCSFFTCRSPTQGRWRIFNSCYPQSGAILELKAVIENLE